MKTLTMYRPAVIQNALSDFDRYFESFFGDSILAPAAKIFNRVPVVDIQETDNAYVLDMELPGYDESNIDVHVNGFNLTIASKQEQQGHPTSPDGRSFQDEKKTEGNYLIRERRVNSFSRSFKLPENADPEAISAAFKNGILSLEIKKRAEAQKRVIQINAA